MIHRRLLRLIRFVAVAAAVSAVAAGAAVLLAPKLVERLAERELERRTGQPVRLEVDSLGLGRTVVRGIELGPGDLAVRRLVFTYDPFDLIWRGEIRKVRVEGMALRGRLGDEVSLGALAPLLARDGGAGRGVSVDSVSIEESRLLLDTPIGRRGVPVEATLERKDGARVFHLRAALAEALQGTPLASADDTSLSLTVSMTEAGNIAGFVRLDGATLFADLDITRIDDVVRVRARDEIRVTAPRLPPELLTLIGLAGHEGPLSLRLRAPGGGPLEITTRGVGEALETRSALRLDLDAGERARLAIETAGAVRFLTDGTLRHLALDRFEGDARVRLPQGLAEARLRIGPVEGSPPLLDAPMRFGVLATDVVTDSFTAQRLELYTEGLLRLDGRRIAFALTTPGWIRAEAPGIADVLRITRPVALPIEAEGDPLLALVLEPGGGGVLRPNLRLGPARVSGVTEGSRQRFEATTPNLSLSGTLDLGSGTFHPRFAASGGKLALPGLDLSAETITASWTGEEDQPRLSLAALLRHTAAQPAVVPLRLAAGVRRDGDALAFAGTLSDITRRLVLDFSGSHDTVTRQGRGRVVAKPITFAPDGLQPRHFFPLLAAHLDDVDGRLALAGPVSWSAAGLAPDLDLLVENLTATTHGVTLTRVNSVVAIERIAPFATPIGQLAAVALVDAGLPLEDGMVIFRLEGKRLTVARAELKLADGRVTLGETVFDPATERQKIALNVSGVDVSKLVEMAGFEGLSATGTLSGRVPLSMGGGKVTVDHGYLAATAPGRLRYRPDLPPATLRSGGQSMELLLKALDNFHYTGLSMTVNGQAGGEITAEFRITGSNPDLYQGYPIELNLNISGALDRILDQALTGYQIPERIRERMAAFGGRLRGAGED